MVLDMSINLSFCRQWAINSPSQFWTLRSRRLQQSLGNLLKSSTFLSRTLKYLLSRHLTIAGICSETSMCLSSHKCSVTGNKIMKTHIFASAEFLKLPYCKASYEMKREEVIENYNKLGSEHWQKNVAGVRLDEITCDCIPRCDFVKGTNKFKPEVMELTLICLRNNI